MATFDYMKPISVRPDKSKPTLWKKLKALARKKKWSLNKYIVEVLNEHVKKAEK